MTVQVDPKTLLKVLATVKPAISPTNAVFAMRGVSVAVTKTAVTLRTGNMDLFIAAPVPGARGDGKWDCVVSHADLVKAVTLFRRNGPITLTAEKDELVCVSDGRTVTLRALRREDFPPFPEPEEARPVIEAAGPEFSTALARAVTFAATDYARPVLCCLLLDWHEDLKIVSTDSYRLAVIGFDGKRKVRKSRDSLKNRLTVHRSLALLADIIGNAATVTIAAADTHVIVTAGDVKAAVSVSRAIFPDYRNLMSDDGFEHEFTVPTADLRTAVATAVTFCRRNSPVRLNVNGTVRLHGWTTDVCSFEEPLPNAVVTEKRGEFEIGLNPGFLRDIAAQSLGDTLRVQLRTPLRSALLSDGHDSYLLMPIRIDV